MAILAHSTGAPEAPRTSPSTHIIQLASRRLAHASAAARSTIEDEIERLIGLLEAFDGDADLESNGDDEPSLGGRAVRLASGVIADDVEEAFSSSPGLRGAL